MKNVKIKEEPIRLGQALKLAAFVGSGTEAKTVIQDGKVAVNGTIEFQRGKKLYSGDIVSYNGETIRLFR